MMMFSKRELDFFYRFKLSSFLLWKGFFYFDDIFFLDKDDFLDLYYTVPVKTFAAAMKGLNEKPVVSLLGQEERENFEACMKDDLSSEEVLKAREEVEKEFFEGLFFYKEFSLSDKLEERKGRQIVRFLSYIRNYFSLPPEKRDDPGFLKKMPFWILAKIIEILPFKEALLYMNFLEEETDFFSGEESPEDKFFSEDIVGKKLMESPYYTSFKIDFSRIFSFRSFSYTFSRGRSFLASEDYREAAAFLERANSIGGDDNFLLLWSYSQALYYAGKKEEGKKFFSMALEKKPVLNKYHLLKAHSLRVGGQISRAIEELEMLTCLSPDYSPGFKMIGKFYTINRKFSEAIECYEKALKLQENDIDVYVELINVHSFKDEAGEAEKTAFKALELTDKDEDRIRLYFKLGEIYRNGENNEKALDFFKKSLDINADYIPSVNGLALVELTLGNREEARKLLEKSLSVEPDVTWFRKILGEIYIENDEPNLARKEFEYMLKINPDDPYALSMVEKLNKEDSKE